MMNTMIYFIQCQQLALIPLTDVRTGIKISYFTLRYSLELCIFAGVSNLSYLILSRHRWSCQLLTAGVVVVVIFNFELDFELFIFHWSKLVCSVSACYSFPLLLSYLADLPTVISYLPLNLSYLPLSSLPVSYMNSLYTLLIY